MNNTIVVFVVVLSPSRLEAKYEFQYFEIDPLKKPTTCVKFPSSKHFPILIRIKAAAWRFNQLDYCVLPREAVYWSFTVPREIP